MKKITRSQKKMLIEKGKTILIIALCVCCVHFMLRIIDLYRVQSDENGILWGDDGSGDLNVTDSESVVSSFWNMSNPQMVMVEHEKRNYLMNPSGEDYAAMNEIIKSAIRDGHLQKRSSFEEKTEADWVNGRYGTSVYVKFSCVHSAYFEAGALSVNESGMVPNASDYSELILLANGNRNELDLLIREEVSGRIYSVPTRISAVKFKELIKKTVNSGKTSHVFASELNLDKAVEGRVSLDSLFLIPIGNPYINNVISRTPKSFTEGIDFTKTSEFSVNLINAFGYNYNTIRQYSDDDGRLIYVGETGTIAVGSDGQIEYKALTDDDGIQFIENDSTNSAYSIVDEIASLNKSILRISGVGNEKNNSVLRFSEFPSAGNLSEVKIVMDYYVDNCKVEFGAVPAVEAVVKNGILVEYRIKVKSIERMESAVPCEDILKAIDAFCGANPNIKRITDGELVYPISADEQVTSAVWKLEGEK